MSPVARSRSRGAAGAPGRSCRRRPCRAVSRRSPPGSRAGSRDMSLLLRQEVGQVVHPGLEEDREVAAVDHLPAELADACHQETKARVQLGRPSRQVHSLHARVLRDELEHAFGHALRHDLRALGASFDVTVVAGLIAEPTDVDLERLDRCPDQRGQAVIAQHLVEREPRRSGARQDGRHLGGGFGHQRHPSFSPPSVVASNIFVSRRSRPSMVRSCGSRSRSFWAPRPASTTT